MLTGQYFNYYRSTCILFSSNFVWDEKAVEDGWLYAKTCLVKRQGRFLEFSFVLEGKNGRIITRKKKNFLNTFLTDPHRKKTERKRYMRRKIKWLSLFSLYFSLQHKPSIGACCKPKYLPNTLYHLIFLGICFFCQSSNRKRISLLFFCQRFEFLTYPVLHKRWTD